MNRKTTLLSIALICVLVGSILLAYAVDIPVNIITGPDEFPETGYDPFLDVTSGTKGYPDGTIDMRDIGLVASRFGAQGNSSRNVTIANWVDNGAGGNMTIIHRTLNASLGYEVALGGWETFYVDSFNVDGYRRVTIMLNATGTVEHVWVGFRIGEIYFEVQRHDSLPSGVHLILNRIEVLGPEIYLTVTNSGSPNVVSIGLYAVD